MDFCSIQRIVLVPYEHCCSKKMNAQSSVALCGSIFKYCVYKCKTTVPAKCTWYVLKSIIVRNPLFVEALDK
jgi:hypothetical protein